MIWIKRYLVLRTEYDDDDDDGALCLACTQAVT